MLGILNAPNLQAVFVDTPGWLLPQDDFQKMMKKAASGNLRMPPGMFGPR